MPTLSSIRLRYYTNDEIRALAVVQVKNPSTYDRGVPKENGINDPRMGVVDHTIRCPTCYKSNCDQHFGFIELARPVYHLGSIGTVIMILRSVCRECAKPKFQIDTNNENKLINISETISLFTNLKERLKTISEMCRSKLVCNWCGAPQPTYSKKDRAFVEATYRPKDLLTPFVIDRGPQYTKFLKSRFMPDDAASVLHALSPETIALLGVDRPESLMCHLQIVPPPIIRPSNFAGETKIRSENDLTCSLQDVVRTNNEMLGFLEKTTSGKDYENLYDKLQVMVSGIVNHAIKRAAAQRGILPLVNATSKRKIVDLRGRLNGKKARVRGNLNGKRVDQSGRTVISGDASHDIDQLGVPSSMMNKLTFPEPVTDLNLEKMKKCILIGAFKSGGAMSARPPTYSSDRVIWISMLDREALIELSCQLRPGWIVERHLVDGDFVLFNRQPSLWKASMLCFRIYRVEGLTARLPLPVTRAFNADFDGDEMNIHALQGYEAVAEARELMRVDKQIITPQSGMVIIGLVQDSLVGAYRLSAQDCFLTKSQAFQLLMCIHYDFDETYMDSDAIPFFGHTTLPTPAILKPQLWTGKQIISFLIPNTISINRNPPLKSMTSPDGVVVLKGQLLAGRLSKTHLGAANTGFIQNIWRLYGPGGAHKFISDAQRLFVKHLEHDGPTQSIIDCIVDDAKVIEILSHNLGRSDKVLGLDLYEGVKEAKSNTILQETLRSVGSHVLTQVRDGALSNCVNSGSKGNVMNIAQIAGCVGQQNIYGKRVPTRQTRVGLRTLIYYEPGNVKAEARGFVANSYMSGLTPAEFFAHQMAGREGIVATAVNTSETGYNQRRMIKGQESQCIGYDGSVRVSSNIIIQMFYGGDDLDGSRLERISIPWLLDNKLGALNNLDCVQKSLKFLKSYAAWNANFYKDLVLTFPCAVAIRSLVDAATERGPVMTLSDFALNVLSIHSRHHSSQKSLLNASVCCAILQFADVCGNSTVYGQFILDHYAQSLVSAGEGVGALGASSIGEPSMQKTLNTFHYTGIADKNVTITGLPRFKQLINGVDTYETSIMSAQLKSFERSSEAVQYSIVMLYDVTGSGRVSVANKVTKPAVFDLFGTQRGNFYIKFGCDPALLCDTLTIDLDWTMCIRKSVTVDIVATALRDLFSYDAIVTKPPHWKKTLSGPRITVILAPWISGAHAIAEALMNTMQVRGIDYVKNSIIFQEKTYGPDCSVQSSHIVETEGSNILDLAKCSAIIPETIRSSNVLEICQCLGISAGIAVLQSELHKVLSFDGTFVDSRHSWLLADTMGRSGHLAAMNRHHMLDLGSSLLQEASFERSLEVFEDGAAFGRSDPLSGATERIIVGQPVSIGTGLVGIVQKEQVLLPEIMVAPLKSTNERFAESHATIVRPLHYKNHAKFDIGVYGVKLSEEDRVCSSSFYLTLATNFRAESALRRICCNLSVQSFLTESHYREALSSCQAFKQWIVSTTTELKCEIFWMFPQSHKYRHTRGMTKREHPISYTIETFSSHTGPHLTASVYSQKCLDPLEIPFGVETIEVVLRQQSTFSKGHFQLILAQEWRAPTNTEAERMMMETKGQFVAILNVAEPEQILQNRCTDSQLANAIYNRVPKI